jgi:hypothetical protein
MVYVNRIVQTRSQTHEHSVCEWTYLHMFIYVYNAVLYVHFAYIYNVCVRVKALLRGPQNQHFNYVTHSVTLHKTSCICIHLFYISHNYSSWIIGHQLSNCSRRCQTHAVRRPAKMLVEASGRLQTKSVPRSGMPAHPRCRYSAAFFMCQRVTSRQSELCFFRQWFSQSWFLISVFVFDI